MSLTGILQTNVQAQAPEKSTNDATGSSVNTEKVKELKEKLATKVAELRLQQKRGFVGEIASLSKNSFTLVTASGEVRVRFSEDTQVLQTGIKRVEKKPQDLTNGNFVSVLGFYEEADKLQQAKVIFLESKPPIHKIGKVLGIDKDKGSISIKTNKNDDESFDYERTTRASEYTVTKTLLKKSGLSRITIGDMIELWVTETDDTHNIVNLVRVSKNLFPLVAGQTSETSGSSNLKSTPITTPKAKINATPQTTPKPKSTPKSTPKPDSSP